MGRMEVEFVEVDDVTNLRADFAGDRRAPSLKVAVEDRAHDRRPCGGAAPAGIQLADRELLGVKVCRSPPASRSARSASSAASLKSTSSSTWKLCGFSNIGRCDR